MLRLLSAGKAERGPYSSFATQVTNSPVHLSRDVAGDLVMVSFASVGALMMSPQQGFLPSEIPMPSPNAISPTGLKSSSQFYSYDGSNPRRRAAQEPIGKKENDL